MTFDEALMTFNERVRSAIPLSTPLPIPLHTQINTQINTNIAEWLCEIIRECGVKARITDRVGEPVIFIANNDHDYAMMIEIGDGHIIVTPINWRVLQDLLDRWREKLRLVLGPEHLQLWCRHNHDFTPRTAREWRFISQIQNSRNY
jgi:hypothetical protein